MDAVLYEIKNLLANMLLNPETVNILFDRILDYFLALLVQIKKYDFIDYCSIGDDWDQQHGLIMGPKMWRKFIKPRLKILFDAEKHGQGRVFLQLR